jgi:hypothetical protein
MTNMYRVTPIDQISTSKLCSVCMVGGKPMRRVRMIKEGEGRSEAVFLKIRICGVGGLEG